MKVLFKTVPMSLEQLVALKAHARETNLKFTGPISVLSTLIDLHIITIDQRELLDLLQPVGPEYF